MMEPFMPHPDTEETVAAADAGSGAPQEADGFGVDAPAAEEFEREGRDPLTHEPLDDDVPFQAPDPDDIGTDAPEG